MTTPDHVNREKAKRLLEPARREWQKAVEEPLSPELMKLLNDMQ